MGKYLICSSWNSYYYKYFRFSCLMCIALCPYVKIIHVNICFGKTTATLINDLILYHICQTKRPHRHTHSWCYRNIQTVITYLKKTNKLKSFMLYIITFKEITALQILIYSTTEQQNQYNTLGAKKVQLFLLLLLLFFFRNNFPPFVGLWVWTCTDCNIPYKPYIIFCLLSKKHLISR